MKKLATAALLLLCLSGLPAGAQAPLPSLGAGNTNTTVNAWGYQR